MGDSDREHPRLVLHGFISQHLCKELEFIHKSCSTVCYRPHVFSTTLSHLIATNCPHLILPFFSIRVCYLNSYGKDFNNGLFHFQDGEPSTIIPMAGDVIMYTADSRNIHSVDEIIDGERHTLTLWFSRDSLYDEDAKLISLLSKSHLSSLNEDPESSMPFPAPSNIYWLSSEQARSHLTGSDIRWARVHVLCFLKDEIPDFTSDSSCARSYLLMKPLWLAREGEIFIKEFTNSLHALQEAVYKLWRVPMRPNASDSMVTNYNLPCRCGLPECRFKILQMHSSM